VALLLSIHALTVGVPGCAAPPADSAPSAEEPLGAMEASTRSRNGLTPNGLITNGLITNGLITNGLITNGLTSLGVNTSSFTTWFDSHPPELSDMVMKYVVTCAHDQGTSLTYRSSTTGATYTWYGLLGLTPGWASGLPISREEEQLVTGCLAAHVNKFGVHMEISIRGETATGTLLSVTRTETTEFSEKEAAFFGNLVTQEGVFACSVRNLNALESSARACGLASQSRGTSVECPPIQHVGSCSTLCTLDRSKNHYASCTFNGTVYKPLTTRVRPSDIYRCGDGTCQFTESCDPDLRSTTNRYDACESDCGDCPP
jgi:hypothetical protein